MPIATSSGRLRRDPLAIVRPFPDPADREVAALVCSTLAFGSVDLIMRACSRALAPLGERPAAALARMGEAELRDAWGGFQYRFCFAEDLIAIMRAIKRGRERNGSLEGLFLLGDPGGPNVVSRAGRLRSRVEARSAFATEGARHEAESDGALRGNLLPDPALGSACKRLFLFLRWMSRMDAVDPGGWARSIRPGSWFPWICTWRASATRDWDSCRAATRTYGTPSRRPRPSGCTRPRTR